MGGEKHPVPLTEPQKAGIASFCPYNIGPVSASRRRFINELMQAIEKVPVRRFAGGLRTVAETAVSVQIIATVRSHGVTRERAGVLGHRQIAEYFPENDVYQRGWITRNPENW